jgi:hypothetical protein
MEKKNDMAIDIILPAVNMMLALAISFLRVIK